MQRSIEIYTQVVDRSGAFCMTGLMVCFKYWSLMTSQLRNGPRYDVGNHDHNPNLQGIFQTLAGGKFKPTNAVWTLYRWLSPVNNKYSILVLQLIETNSSQLQRIRFWLFYNLNCWWWNSLIDLTVSWNGLATAEMGSSSMSSSGWVTISLYSWNKPSRKSTISFLSADCRKK